MMCTLVDKVLKLSRTFSTKIVWTGDISKFSIHDTKELVG
jgi:hypothetical protein